MELTAGTSKKQSSFKDGNLMYPAYHAEVHLRKGNRIDFTCGKDHHHATVLEVKEGNIIVIRADGWQNTCEERLYCWNKTQYISPLRHYIKWLYS